MSHRGGQFGRFRILEPLATGGMAVVYRALIDGPKGISRPIAIKRIRPELASDDAFRTMMLDEARLCARLQHPNIVHLIECGEAEGELYVAMELIEGIDLRTLINRSREHGQRIPSPLVAFIGAQLTAALTYAHTLTSPEGPLQLVHRDISPSNVMLTPDGTVKLLDFGIAKAVGVLRDHQTRTGVVKGKFSYMSPEQGSGAEVDHRSDLFSLGVVLFELITLTHPFRGPNDLATLRQVIELEPPPVTRLAPEFEPAWNELVATLLAKRPGDRFQSGAMLERALLALAGGEGNAATLRTFLQPLLTRPAAKKDEATGSFEVDSLPAPGSPATETVPAASPRARWILPVIGLTVAAVAVTVLSAWPSRSPPVESAPVITPALATPRPPPPPAEPLVAPSAPPEIELQITGSKGAAVRLDAKLVGTTPLSLTLPVSSDRRLLQVDKAGFQRFSRELPGDRTAVIDVQLKPLPRKKSAPVKRRPEDTPDPFQ